MTLYDDPATLLTRLRHTFITKDDTGLSEMVITHDTVKSDEWSIIDNCIVIDPAAQENLSTSPDIYPEVEYGARRHRRRSQTDERLDKLKKDKQAYTTQHIHWRKTDEEVSDTEREKLFEFKDISKMEDRELKKGKKSLLSQNLEISLPDNPFQQFAKFDCKANAGSHSRSLIVYVIINEESQPVSIVVLNTASVRDTIGLVCWQYTTDGKQPELNSNLDFYDLYMEDCGQADMDFPPMDKVEMISKFGFSRLAMVQHEKPKTPKKSANFVTVHISTKGMTKVQIDDVSTPMRVILEKVMKRRVAKDTLAKRFNYNLEKYDEPGVAIDLNLALSTMNTSEFFMVRENSARGVVLFEETPEVDDSVQIMADSLSALQYKLFSPVYMSHKLLPQKKEYTIGISRDQVEIHQVSKSRPGKFKSAIYTTAQVAACEIHELKSSKTGFRFIYQSPGSKTLEHHDFECDQALCFEIVNKINHIVDYFSGPVRMEYLKTRGGRRSQRKSLYSES